MQGSDRGDRGALRCRFLQSWIAPVVRVIIVMIPIFVVLTILILIFFNEPRVWVRVVRRGVRVKESRESGASCFQAALVTAAAVFRLHCVFRGKGRA